MTTVRSVSKRLAARKPPRSCVAATSPTTVRVFPTDACATPILVEMIPSIPFAPLLVIVLDMDTNMHISMDISTDIDMDIITDMDMDIPMRNLRN